MRLGIPGIARFSTIGIAVIREEHSKSTNMKVTSAPNMML